MTAGLYGCGESSSNTVLMVDDDGKMFVCNHRGGEVIVRPSLSAHEAGQILRRIYAQCKDELDEEMGWNRLERELAVHENRAPNYRDTAFSRFWLWISESLGA